MFSNQQYFERAKKAKSIGEILIIANEMTLAQEQDRISRGLPLFKRTSFHDAQVVINNENKASREAGTFIGEA